MICKALPSGKKKGIRDAYILLEFFGYKRRKKRLDIDPAAAALLI
jgi:hypothetical protein